jgi:CDP-diacylglycerol--glycerol-3-phosphate 3-phosphatidyltransferase/cardiolipin synthase
MLLYDAPLFGAIDCRRVGTWLIWVAAVLTVWSMFYYLKKAMPYMRGDAG